MNKFLELQQRVKTVLNEEFQKSNMNIIQVMSALALLGQAKNEEELWNMIDIFSTDYKALAYLLEAEKEKSKVSFESNLQDVVTRMIKDNPKEASRLAKFASDPNATKEELLKQFPDANKYF